MATVDKNFKVKHGLVVEGTTATVNGNDILTTASSINTDFVSETTLNRYFTDQRAKDAAATLLTGATLTNITISGDGSGLTITAENGVADATTDDLDEGLTNLYFTNERAQDAVGNSVGGGLSYDDASGAISVNLTSGGGLGITSQGTLGIKRSTVDSWYDAAGSASTAQSNAETFATNAINALTTDSIEEGLGNLYFTEARAQAVVISSISGTGPISVIEGVVALGTDGSTLTTDGNGKLAVDTDVIATKAYADGIAQGLNVKESVVTATTSNITDLSGGFGSIGGVSVSTGDRVLVKDQDIAGENGIYYVNNGGGLSRAADSNFPEVGDYVFVESGTNQARGYIVTSVDAFGFVWTQFSAAGQYVAGNGITISGTSIAIDGSVVATQSDLSTGLGTKQNTFTAGPGMLLDGGSLNLVTGNGLAVDGPHALYANTDETTITNASGPSNNNLAVKYGNGLTVNTTGLIVDPGFGISVDGGGVNVDLTAIAGSGLSAGSLGLSVDTSTIASVDYVDTGLATKQDSFTPVGPLSISSGTLGNVLNLSTGYGLTTSPIDGKLIVDSTTIATTSYVDTNFVNVADLPGQLGDYIPLTQKDSPNGVATLDETGNVPAGQLANVPAAYITSTDSNFSVSGGKLQLSNTIVTPSTLEVSGQFTVDGGINFGSTSSRYATQVGQKTTLSSGSNDVLYLHGGSAEIVLSVETASGKQVSKLLMVTDSLHNIYITEYGVVDTGVSVATIDATWLSGASVYAITATVSESGTATAIATELAI